MPGFYPIPAGAGDATAAAYRTSKCTRARVLDEILSGGFARRFQQEARDGYPMLGVARNVINSQSPLTDAETALRQAAGLPAPSTS